MNELDVLFDDDNEFNLDNGIADEGFLDDDLDLDLDDHDDDSFTEMDSEAEESFFENLEKDLDDDLNFDFVEESYDDFDSDFDDKSDDESDDGFDGLENEPVFESEVVLTALRSECDSEEEFAAILEAAATELALYDVLCDADYATEASKKVIIKDYKGAKLNQVATRTAIRLAQNNNDPLYKKYVKYRTLFLDARAQIYKKYGNKAKSEARRIVRNASKKSSPLTSNAGKSVANKLKVAAAKMSKDK